MKCDNVRNEFLKFSDTRLTLIRLERFLEGVLTLIKCFLLFKEEVFTISVSVLLLLFEEVTVLLSDMLFVSLISSNQDFQNFESPR